MTFFLAISAFIKHYFSSFFACAVYDLFSFYILCYVATLVTNGYTICCGALSLYILGSELNQLNRLCSRHKHKRTLLLVKAFCEAGERDELVGKTE